MCFRFTKNYFAEGIETLQKERNETEGRAKKSFELYEYIRITFKLKVELVMPKNRPPWCHFIILLLL